MGKSSQDDIYIKMVWDFFELHAAQRITLFRLYLIFITLFIYGLGYLLTRCVDCKSPKDELLAIGICILFIVITIIFQKLDLRNEQLINYARKALCDYEKNIKKSKNDTKNIEVFTLIEEHKKEYFTYINHTASHTTCFKYLFWTAYLIALMFIVISMLGMGMLDPILKSFIPTDINIHIETQKLGIFTPLCPSCSS